MGAHCGPYRRTPLTLHSAPFSSEPALVSQESFPEHPSYAAAGSHPSSTAASARPSNSPEGAITAGGPQKQGGRSSAHGAQTLDALMETDGEGKAVAGSILGSHVAGIAAGEGSGQDEQAGAEAGAQPDDCLWHEVRV